MKSSQNKTIAYWIPYIQKFWVGSFIVKDDPGAIIIQIPLPLAAVGQSLNVHLVMRANFPASPPEFYVTADMVLPGVIDEGNKRIRHPMLDSWNDKQSLTEVIKNIHFVFNSTPPQPRQQQAGMYQPAGYAGPPAAAPLAQKQEEKKKEAEKKMPEYKLDEVKVAKIELDMLKPRLESMELEHLRELEQNPQKLEEFFAEEEGVLLIKAKIDSYKELLANLALSNLDSKQELKVMNESMDGQFGTLGTLQERSKELRAQMTATTSDMNPKKVKNILVNRARQADQVSEVCKKSFLNGEIDHKKFQREYIDQRKEFHYYNTLAKKVDSLAT